MTTTEALLAGCIDYAGLFPPAHLDLETTVENYRSYRAGSQAWALGRLILPANKVATFAETWPSFASEWPISLLMSPDVVTDWHSAFDRGLCCDVFECMPMPVQEIAAVRRLLPAATTVYFEVPTGSDPEPAIEAIAAAGSRAKLRTGGTTPDAFPSVLELVRFLSCCVKHRVAFKATAGLHHPLRGVHALTYEAQSDSILMHGYVNFILASILLQQGGEIAEASALLDDTSAENFRFAHEQISWLHRDFTRQQIIQGRVDLMVSFGSCSFTEPLEGIAEFDQMGLSYEA
jgi:hypothetical protein